MKLQSDIQLNQIFNISLLKLKKNYLPKNKYSFGLLNIYLIFRNMNLYNIPEAIFEK